MNVYRIDTNEKIFRITSTKYFDSMADCRREALLNYRRECSHLFDVNIRIDTHLVRFYKVDEVVEEYECSRIVSR